MWATAVFDMPDQPIAKSALYNSRVADAAMACIGEVVRKVADGERPMPGGGLPADRAGRRRAAAAAP